MKSEGHYQGYRESLAQTLQETRGMEGGNEAAKRILSHEQATREYQIAERLVRDAAKAKIEGKEDKPPFESIEDFLQQVDVSVEFGPDISSADTDESGYTGTYYSAEKQLNKLNAGINSDEERWRMPTAEEAKKMLAPIKSRHDRFKSIEHTGDPAEVAQALHEYQSTLNAIMTVLGSSRGREIDSPEIWTSKEISELFQAYADLTTGDTGGMSKSLWDGQADGPTAILVRNKQEAKEA